MQKKNDSKNETKIIRSRSKETKRDRELKILKERDKNMMKKQKETQKKSNG